MESQKALEEKILKYNELYRIGEPSIFDKEYDELLEKLNSNYPESRLLTTGVLESTPKSRKDNLPIRMASLDKKKTIEEIELWGKSIGLSDLSIVVISPKYDGISILNKGGKSWTRGDGFIGQRSDKHISKFSNNNFEESETIGEAIIQKEKWNNLFKHMINPKSGMPYKSARNTVAGLINSDSISENLEHVDLVVYGSTLQMDKVDQLSYLKDNGCENVSDYIQVTFRSINYDLLEQLHKNWSSYEIDGIVIEVNDYRKRAELGRMENGNPAYSIAYKNPAWGESFITTATDIEINVSKQGKLIPVVLIDPIDVNGVIVSRASGYNMKFVYDNKISKGAEVEVTRSGEVIPKILKTISSCEDSLVELMDELCVCPECGEVVKWDETMTNLVCSNNDCKGIKLAKIEHFFESMKFEEFSDASIKPLFENGYDSIERILSITDEQLLQINGWGESSVLTLRKQIDKLDDPGVPFARLVYSLDLFQGVIGEKTCQLILDNVDIDELLDGNIREEDILTIKGVGDITAKLFLKGINRFMKEFVTISLNHIGVTYYSSPKQEIVNESMANMKVCFSGVRDKDLENEIKSFGGEIVSGVSKKTTDLIVKDYSEEVMSSAKCKDAKKIGINITSINDFKTKMNYGK